MPPLEYLHIICDERANLLIGPNASGKSTILRAVKGFYSLGADGLSESGGVEFSNSLGEKAFFYLEASEDWPRNDSVPDPDYLQPVKWDSVPLLYVPATRINLLSKDIFGHGGYGFDGYDTGDPLKSLFETDSGIFHGSYVERAIDTLRDLLTDNNYAITRQLRDAIKVGYMCAKDICREVIYDDTPHVFVDFDDDDSETERIVHYGMGIVTSDNILGEPLYAGALSSGTQGTLLWLWALALKMAVHYDWKEGWEQKPAILLIDEIENHLHPTWQRRVIPALLEHFPGLQIFATTHSPFVVAGLKAGQVHLLNRDEKGVVTATTNTEDIIGWTADEILRTMMGVDEPTDQLTVDRANRLRQLREKEKLTPEEESELNGLRRQVNEDLLSKAGPLEAQRERYAGLMEKFLLSRQSDLTQD